MTTEAPEEYLWDMSGEPDEHTRTLERLLGRYRLDPSDAPVEDADGESNGTPECQ